MRKNFMMSGLAALAVGFASTLIPLNAGALPEADGALGLGVRRHKGKGQNTTRGRGKVSKPRKRTNRQIISKRVRRKHRRAGR